LTEVTAAFLGKCPEPDVSQSPMNSQAKGMGPGCSTMSVA